MPDPTDPDLPPLSEPLEELARFAFESAPHLCRAEHGCAPYHRAWSMVRLLLKSGALPAGAEYFRPWLQAATRDGRCRVLLSGAADTGLAAMVLQTMRAARIRAEIVLADRCATTLEQNRRFADRIGARFELHQTDLASLACAPVDVVLTHSFLNFLPPDARPGLVATWARTLRPGGVLVGLQRFGATGRDRDPGRIAADAERLEIAAVSQGFPPEDAARVRQAAEDFWAARLTFPGIEADAFVQLLRNAGLELLDRTSLALAATASPMRARDEDRSRPQDVFAARKPA